MRRTCVLILIIISLAGVFFPSSADEGMWLPESLDKLPWGKLKNRGLHLNTDDLYSATKPSLKDAIVLVGGKGEGTGAFISAEGLILTNHHVAFNAATAASATEKDYTAQGFLAKTRGEEIPARGYTVSITQELRDVTAEVNSAVTPMMTNLDRSRAIGVRCQEIARAANKEGIRAEVVSMMSGLSYYLCTYVMLQDVRLVYVPPISIGAFGGDQDNFEWPRHAGDFSFMRAYVGPDGKPADFNPHNVPFKPKRFLTISLDGHKEGDFVMALGYPGLTYRYRESYSVEHHQMIRLPFLIDALQAQIELLTAAGERDPALKIKFADEVRSLNNRLKDFQGTLTLLRRSKLVERKQAEEAAFIRALEANPAMNAKYGNILPRMAAQYGEINSFILRQNALNNLLGAGDLIQHLALAYQRALEGEKPPGERSPQFSDDAIQRLTASLDEIWKERVPAVEQQRLASALALFDRLPTEQRSQTVEKLFDGKREGERGSAVARRLFEATRFKSAEALAKLFSLSASEIRAIADPLLKLVIDVKDELAPLDQRADAFNLVMRSLRALLVRGILEWKEDLYYPDANRTLRFTYGEIKGYRSRDAVIYEHLTSLTGMIEKDTGRSPFDVPPKLKELRTKKDFKSYVEPRIKDVPVDFIATTDITGGNSGSPVMNGRGEMIGLVFDINYEGLGSNYVYNPALSRTIAVDIRYVMFITDKFAGAGYLFNEMQIQRGNAMAAN